jgi:hypothetical protein
VDLISRTGAGLPANGGSSETAISPNGRYVAFTSDANNLSTATQGAVGREGTRSLRRSARPRIAASESKRK